MCVWVWAGGERSERARVSNACRLVAELTADCYIAAATAAIAARCLLRAARAAFCRKGRLVSCRLVPSSGFVGVHSLSAIPGGECDEQTRARCCVGAGAGAGFAAARRTLRWIFKLLAACLALFLFFCCCCRRGCVDASASCAATQALQRRHTGARCRAKCVCCCCRRCCCYCCCCCCCYCCCCCVCVCALIAMTRCLCAGVGVVVRILINILAGRECACVCVCEDWAVSNVGLAPVGQPRPD